MPTAFSIEHPERKEVLYRGTEPIFSAADLGKPAAGKDGIWLIAQDTEGNCSLKLITPDGREIKSFETDANTFDELLVSDTELHPFSPGPFISQGLLLDLNEFFQNDDEISPDDLSIKDALCVDGELFVIGSSFNFYTLAGRESDFGDRTGWKFDECLEMGKKLPAENVLSNYNAGSFSEYILYPNILNVKDFFTEIAIRLKQRNP